MKKHIINCLAILLSGFYTANAQNKDSTITDNDLVQFSGVVMTSDSLIGIPYVSVVIRRTKMGSYSDYNGYFNFVAHKGDTIDFGCIGFKNSSYIIPDTLKNQKYSMVKLMTADTVYLDVSVITPLPKRDMFDYYFVKADIPDDDMERARKNLERERLKEESETLHADGKEAGKFHLQQQARAYYSAGQIAPNNLLNPLAWAQFFEAWKRGDFKKQDKKITGEE
ncbi:MAG: carboxypeptidase-like regulatory domain-containing protein [Bacteroidetes bacterium]|nr:carboxypeptidase-like regulatory domain-containing protein [Bacteroidota bacterium]